MGALMKKQQINILSKWLFVVKYMGNFIDKNYL